MGALIEAWHTLVPPRSDRDGPLSPALVLLTIATGAVDAVSYLSLGHVFVANMTGNVVFLGFAAVGAGGFTPGPSLTALAAFAVGSAAGGRLAAARRDHRGRLLASALALQAALILVACLVSGLARGGAASYTLIALLAASMGLQNAAVRRLGVPDLTTTVLTMTVTGMFADGRALGGPGAAWGRRALSVASMIAGAVTGSVLLLHASQTAALLVPLGLVVAVAAGIGGLSRRRPAWSVP
ncbi:MAG: DUF1275 domain-containing protein [Candidatus Dormibacteraeota bacterium]|nr:DUF1275 domain-containing protein [Candidatus Dormibacteraeota bacterium]